MGPSSTWLFLLVLVSLIVGDAALVRWLMRQDAFPERKALLVTASGAVLALFGQGLVHLTRHSHGWLDGIAWTLMFSGYVLLLAGILGVLVTWTGKGQRRQLITDPTEYYEAQKRYLAFLEAPLSAFFPRMALESRFGLAMGILLLIATIGVSVAFSCEKVRNNAP